MGTYFFSRNFYLSFILFLFKGMKKITARNALLTEIKSSPPERAREEVFEPIPSDTTSICHKIYIKLFLVNDIINISITLL